MTLVLIVIVLAAIGALLLGGRPSRLRELRLRRRRLLLTAAGALLLGALLGSAWRPALLVGVAVACGAMAYFAWLNSWIAGVPLIGTGVVLNGLVLVVNGAVPVSLTAAERAGSDLTAADLLASPWREAEDATTVLPFLGDVLPLAWPVAPQVVSLGDLLVAAGCALVVARGMTGERGQRPELVLQHGRIEPVGTAPGAAPGPHVLEGALPHGQEGP